VSDCVLCGLVEGALESSPVYDDERAVAFMDIQPVNPGHVLVVPRRHTAALADLDAEDAAHLMRVAQRITAALPRSGLRAEGVNLWLADGEAAGQDVFHVHLHVVPRFAGDGFGLHFGPDYRVRERSELDEAAERIRGALA
jgi:histidine triad (HIT) family protein